MNKFILAFLALLIPTGCVSTPDPRFQDENFEPGSANAILYESCDNGNGEACLNLADKFDAGTGVTRHMGLALKYYNKACNLDNEEGCDVYFGVINRAADRLQKNTDSALDSE